mmetsp:Transcript_166586/g.529366  ORF Transcript_166586/g.529366 Transcript_166586/m.529366 type:complete len:248 (-) Transcript_166586:595-1338(-)
MLPAFVFAPVAATAAAETMACFAQEKEAAGKKDAMFSASAEESDMSTEKKACQKKMDEGLSANVKSYLNGTTPAECGQDSSVVKAEAKGGCVCAASNMELGTTPAGGANSSGDEGGRVGSSATATAAELGGGGDSGFHPLRGCLDGLLESASAEETAAQQPPWGATAGYSVFDKQAVLGAPVFSERRLRLPVDVQFLLEQLLVVRLRRVANANEAHMEEGQDSDDDSDATSNGQASDANTPRMPEAL